MSSRIVGWWSSLNRWQRFRGLTPAQQGLFFRSLIMLPLAAAAIRLKGLGWVQQRALSRHSVPQAEVASRLQLDQAHEAAVAIDIAARRGIWTANCLQRSVVLWRELLRLGVNGDLRIGVGPGTARPEMHAWVEVGDVVVNDAPDVGDQFRPFDKPILPPRARFD